MRDTMFDIPSREGVRQVIITRAAVTDKTEPEVVMGDPPIDLKEA